MARESILKAEVKIVVGFGHEFLFGIKATSGRKITQKGTLVKYWIEMSERATRSDCARNVTINGFASKEDCLEIGITTKCFE